MDVNRRKWKVKAVGYIQTVRPNPCLVTLVVVAYGWMVSWITQRIGGQPLYFDLDALEAMDLGHLVGWDWSNWTTAPTSWM